MRRGWWWRGREVENVRKAAALLLAPPPAHHLLPSPAEPEASFSPLVSAAAAAARGRATFGSCSSYSTPAAAGGSRARSVQPPSTPGVSSSQGLSTETSVEDDRADREIPTVEKIQRLKSWEDVYKDPMLRPLVANEKIHGWLRNLYDDLHDDLQVAKQKPKRGARQGSRRGKSEDEEGKKVAGEETNKTRRGGGGKGQLKVSTETSDEDDRADWEIPIVEKIQRFKSWEDMYKDPMLRPLVANEKNHGWLRNLYDHDDLEAVKQKPKRGTRQGSRPGKSDDEEGNTVEEGEDMQKTHHGGEGRRGGKRQLKDELEVQDAWSDEWEEEEEVELKIGDGKDGGGVVLGDVAWGEQVLSMANEVLCLHFGEDIKMHAFKVSTRGYIYVRLDKLPNRYGCPNLEEIEKFNRLYKKCLEEAGNRGEIPEDLALEVSSPGAERLLKVPDDLARFKKMPMIVLYLEEDTDAKHREQKEGVFLLASSDTETQQCVWKLADVKENRDVIGKGKPLTRKQKVWRLTLPFEMMKRVTLYVNSSP